MIRVYLAGVLISALGVNAQTLSGKYCGSSNIMGMAKLASVISFDAEKPVASFDFFTDYDVFSFTGGVWYELSDSGDLVIQPNNAKFNAFLASFPLALTPASFVTKYHEESDHLVAQIGVNIFLSVTVELSRGQCNHELLPGRYSTGDSKIIADIDTKSSKVVISVKDVADKIFADGPLSYVLRSDGVFTLTKADGESPRQIMKQVPGSDAFSLTVADGGIFQGRLLSRVNEDMLAGL